MRNFFSRKKDNQTLTGPDELPSRVILNTMLSTRETRHTLFHGSMKTACLDSILFLLMVQQYEIKPTRKRFDLIFSISIKGIDKPNISSSWDIDTDSFGSFVQTINIPNPIMEELYKNKANEENKGFFSKLDRKFFEKARAEVYTLVARHNLGSKDNIAQILDPGQVSAINAKYIQPLRDKLKIAGFPEQEMGIW